MAKICMNEVCQATTTIEWKKGWALKSGGFASLCHNCGSAYENSLFCETFHLEESGWRKCKLCGKRIHCGCIASKFLHEYLDFGGIGCISCVKSLETHSIRPIQISNDDVPNGFGPLTANNINGPHSSFIENRLGGISIDKQKLMKFSKSMDAKELSRFPQSQLNNSNALSIGRSKREETMHPILMQQSVGSSIFAKPENSRPILGGVNDMFRSLAQPSSGFSSGTSLDTPNPLIPSLGGVGEGSEHTKMNKIPPFQQGQRTRHILPKPTKGGPAGGSDANNVNGSETRVARPPAEGRGRHQLLPRYWPRITDQELQQISGDLNSTIVPLFEKVLSASDAGRIGRLVLPKACAEAYFPPISQSEGIPIIIQDVKGKEWTFQFRFWPNNNSRMYVLEGVTPCIQNMQLEAGDTVIFSRLDPGGKLVMGFRKASNSVDMQQDNQTPSVPNGAPSGETTLSGVNDNLPTQGGRTNEDSSQRPLPVPPEKKRSRNIGSKSKRLLMRSEDAMELRITWAEAQDLLRPPPSVTPTIVMIEDQEFEEYNEPPVFGKKTIFAARAGEEEQWAQCDNCSKWRKLPMDVLLPPKWTCSDNIWDSNRCSCSAPEGMDLMELENLLRAGKEFKKRRISESPKVTQEPPSGLDALATAAVLGDNAIDADDPSSGPTTKHPRHRSGCTCIVCIQPPSGKGRHKSSCTCTVCVTVKRRFETLMSRRKKREEVEIISRGKEPVGPSKDESESMDGTTSNHALPGVSQRQDDRDRVPKDVGETSNGQLDLNCDPNSREDETAVEADASLSITSLVHAACLRVETSTREDIAHMRENGISSLGPCTLSRAAGESEVCPPDGHDGDEG